VGLSSMWKHLAIFKVACISVLHNWFQQIVVRFETTCFESCFAVVLILQFLQTSDPNRCAAHFCKKLYIRSSWLEKMQYSAFRY
jgi:hypothetical protein